MREEFAELGQTLEMRRIGRLVGRRPYVIAIAGSVANVRRGLVNLRDGLIIGVVAACLTPAGTWIAGSISARMGANLFAVYLCVIGVRSVWAAVNVTPALAKRLPHRNAER